MGKIPVARTIASAYGFLFGRFFTILGLSWLPATFLCGVLAYDFAHLGGDPAASFAGRGPGGPLLVLAQSAGLLGLALLLVTAISVPLARQALGLRDERVAVHLVIGGREFSLFFAQIRFFLLLFGAVFLVAAFLGVGLSVGLAQFADVPHVPPPTWHGIPIMALAAGITATAALLTLIVAGTRLGFFLVAIASIEDGTRLVRALELSRGNLLRLVMVSAFLVIPVAAVLCATVYALFGAELAAMLPILLRHRDPQPLFQFLAAHALALAAVVTIIRVLGAVLFAGAAASAYRVLVPAGATIAEWHRNEHVPSLPPHKHPARRPDDTIAQPVSAPLGGDLVFAAEERIAERANADALAAMAQPAWPAVDAIAPAPEQAAPLASDQVHPLATFHAAPEASDEGEHGSAHAETAIGEPANAPEPYGMLLPAEYPISTPIERVSEEAWEKLAAAAVLAEAQASGADADVAASTTNQEPESEFEMVEEPPPEPPAEQHAPIIAEAAE